MSVTNWGDMSFWDSGEYQWIEEQYADAKKQRKVFNPPKEKLFEALRACPLEKTKVCILGQDPYPEHKFASGIAFSVETKEIPPSLQMIFREYEDDLHYPKPKSGSLKKWADEGVLLWNVFPSCQEGKSMSHSEWPWPWEMLTQEILTILSSETSCVFSAWGGVPRGILDKYVSEQDSYYVNTSHPSPRGNMSSKTPFLGSRIFSSINGLVVKSGQEPINWRL